MPRKKNTRNHLGSIFPRQIIKHGRKITVYDVRKRYRDSCGTYRDITKRCYSHGEALIALANMPAEIQKQQIQTVAEQQKVHTFLDLTVYYRQEYCKPAVFVGNQQISGFRQDPTTIKGYLKEYEEFFGDLPLADLTYEHLRSFAVHVATTPIRRHNAKKPATQLPKPATVNRKLAYLRRLLNIGKRKRWLAVNPFSEGEPLIKSKSEHPKVRVLSYEEEPRLLAACTEKDAEDVTWRGRPVSYERPNQRQHLRLIVIMAIDTGMRNKEIFSLQRRDILLEQKIIELPAKKTKALKGRVIVISERLEEELRTYFNHFQFAPNDLLFFGHKDCATAFKTACKKAGIAGLTFHSLRRTATTWLDEAGVSQAAKQNMIGHASDRVHQDYHSPSIDILNSIRNKMDTHRRDREHAQGEMDPITLADDESGRERQG